MLIKVNIGCLASALGLALAAAPVTVGALDTQVRVDLTGVIPVVCEIARRGPERQTIDLSKSGERSFAFDIDCNAPMTVTLSAKDGQIRNAAPIEHTAQFVRGVAYAASFLVDLPQAGDDVVVVPETNGATLVSGVSHATTEPPYETTAALRVRWMRDSRRLVAGAYAETVTVLVSGQI